MKPFFFFLASSLCLKAAPLSFEDKKFYFHHIPKTAGISTLVYISDALRHEIQFIDLNPGKVGFHFPFCSHSQAIVDHYDKIFLDEKNDKILWSHCPYYYLDKYKDSTFMFTLLRNPTQRAISHRRFFKLQVHVRREEILHAQQELLQSSDTHNLQTLYLTALDPFNPLISMEAHLESAKHTLEHKMDFVGFTENLKPSLDQMLWLFGKISNQPLQKINVTNDKRELDEKYDFEQIKKDNWADFELYEFAKNLKMKT